MDRAGRPIAALNVSVPTARWEEGAVREQLIPDLLDAAAMISKSHGLWNNHPWFAKSMAAKA